jgi:HPt (histidine-containing phosphotransfer) domain-containing protein
VAINLAGRQRYVSQRIARTLLELDAARAAGRPHRPETLAELRAGTKIFDLSQAAFRKGDTIPGGDGKPVFLDAVTSERGRALEAQVDALWGPYFRKLQPLMVDGFAPEDLAAALAYSQANNIQLLNVANDFVTETQAIGASRASTLRMVQTGGIVLALLNFAFILLKFLRRLQTSDAAIEAANDENREILQSVREGLFLITPDFRSARSCRARRMRCSAATSRRPGLLRAAGAAADRQGAVRCPRLRAAAVRAAREGSAGAGHQPAVRGGGAGEEPAGQEQIRHLSFHFNRVVEDGAVQHLLVTVQDVSARIELEHKLQSERLRSQKEFEMLLRAVDADPALLRQFVTRAEQHLLEVNDLLRSTSSAQGEAAVLQRVDEARRRVHALKGDAAVLGLETLASQAHAFEDTLDRIRQGGGAGDVGQALLALPLPLEELLAKVGALKNLAGLERTASAQAAPAGSINTLLAGLAGAVARDCGKKVLPQVAVGALADLRPTRPTWCARPRCSCCAMPSPTAWSARSPQRQRQGRTGNVSVRLVRADAEWELTCATTARPVGRRA